MDIKAKLRPFYVAKMLNERTDEEHYLTIAQIMDILEKEYGISTSRGTVGDDIKALQEFGMEIGTPTIIPYMEENIPIAHFTYNDNYYFEANGYQIYDLERKNGTETITF